jgi:hypothetical protein
MVTLLLDVLVKLDELDDPDDPDDPVPKLVPLRSPGRTYPPSAARALTVKRAAIAIVNFISFRK